LEKGDHVGDHPFHLLSAVYFPVNDVDKIPVLFQKVDVPVEHADDALGEGAVADQGGMKIPGKLFEILIEDAFEQPLFAAEMVMDESLVGFGNVGDLSDRCRIKPHFSEHPVRSLQNPFPRLHGFLCK
jgi:hypothetical protein